MNYRCGSMAVIQRRGVESGLCGDTRVHDSPRQSGTGCWQLFLQFKYLRQRIELRTKRSWVQILPGAPLWNEAGYLAQPLNFQHIRRPQGGSGSSLPCYRNPRFSSLTNGEDEESDLGACIWGQASPRRFAARSKRYGTHRRSRQPHDAQTMAAICRRRFRRIAPTSAATPKRSRQTEEGSGTEVTGVALIDVMLPLTTPKTPGCDSLRP